jgi:hypothetical protein
MGKKMSTRMRSTGNDGTMRQKHYQPLDIDKARANAPAEMQAAHQWCVWKMESDEKNKPTKVPYNAQTGRAGSSTNPKTWSTFDEAIQAYERGGYHGIGFYFGNGFAGIDLDACRDPLTNDIEAWVLEIINQVITYWEVSPSQTGLHAFAKANLPGKGIKREVYGCKIEIYDSGRFFTFTGERLECSPKETRNCNDEVQAIYKKVLELDTHQKAEKAKQKCKPQSQVTAGPSGEARPVLSDDEVVTLALNAKNGARLERLWAGDTSNFASPSEADASLVSTLCFYCGDDAQVERLWKTSKLYRNKLERADYIRRTIAWMRSVQTDHYSCDRQSFANQDVLDEHAESFEQAASAMDDCILLVLTELCWGEEDKMTLLALFSIFGGRRTAAFSRVKLASRIRKRENSTPAGAKAEDQFGGRRLTNLRKALRMTIDHPVLVLKKQGGKRAGINKKTGNYFTSRWQLDMAPFLEVITLSKHYLHEWNAGQPRFEEWRESNGNPQKPNPGWAREKAAQEIARKYRKGDEPAEHPEGMKKSDKYSRWIQAEYQAEKAVATIADLFDKLDKEKPDKHLYGQRFMAHLLDILLQDDKRERRRKVEESQRLTQGGLPPYTFMHEGRENGSSPYNNDNVSNKDYAKPTRTGTAIWRDGNSEKAVTVTSWQESGGSWFARIAESATSIPAEHIEFLPDATAPPEQAEVFTL